MGKKDVWRKAFLFNVNAAIYQNSCDHVIEFYVTVPDFNF